MLENFHNTLSTYCPKRNAFRLEIGCTYNEFNVLSDCNNSDGAYRSRIQLAVIDHNAHLSRSQRIHIETEAYQYHRKYHKQTKNWDVVRVLEAKEYK